MIDAVLALPIIFIFILVGLIVFWLWTIWDVLTAKNTVQWKILWLLVIVIFEIFGSLLYYLIVIRKVGNGQRR